MLLILFKQKHFENVTNIYLFRALVRYIKLLLQIRAFSKKDVSVADVFRQHVSKHPNKVCFIFEDKEWTFAQVRGTLLTTKNIVI